MFNDTAVKLEFHGDMVAVIYGTDTYYIERTRLASCMTGNVKPFDCLLYNIGVRLAVSNVDPNDDAAIKEAVESAAFKF